MTDVFVYGETNLDNIIQVPYLPTPGRAAAILSDTFHLGGVGANAAVMLAHWGLAVRLAGNAVGQDEYGQITWDQLAACPNLDLTWLEHLPGIRTPFCRIMVTPDGERSQLYGFGDFRMTRFHTGMLGGARFLSLDLYGGEERAEAARMAKAAGVRLVIGDITPLDHPLLPLTDIAANSAALMRREYPDEDPFEHARRLHEISGGVVLTTDGPDPVQAIDRDGSEFWVTPPRVHAVDATGAGDAFKAGVIFGLHRGWDLETSVCWGVAAGSLNTRFLGATRHPPDLAEIEALIPLIKTRGTR